MIKMMPALFKKNDLKDFCLTLGNERTNDCFDGITFLYSSKYQENDGAKLVMMLSAIERSCGRWQPLETFLRSKKLKEKMSQVICGKEAYSLLESSIEDYLDNFGSTRSIVKFFSENLTKRDKLILTEGIRRLFFYKKQADKIGTVFEPNYQNKQEDINTELKRVLKSFIYYIRNNFVHKANYIIIPNKKYMKSKRGFELDIYENGIPKEHWITILPFEKLHKLFCKAFSRYWNKEYNYNKQR